MKRGFIAGIGPSDVIQKKNPGCKVIYLPNAVLLPGLINTHTHLELPPLPHPLRTTTFPDWVLNLIKIKQGLNRNDYVLAVKNSIQAIISSGTTTVSEICTHGVSPVLLKKSGIRATIYRELIAMNPIFPFPQLSSMTRPSSLIRTGMSPHAPHTVSEQILSEIKKTADRKSLPLSMHVAESKDETRLLQGKKSGFEKLYAKAGWDLAWAPKAESPFEYLHRLGLLGPRFLAVHAAQAIDRDIALIRRTRTPIAHCPRSNKELGVGRMPLRKFLDAGITVGLGTDSLASSPNLNMWDEMRYALKIHKKDGITARDIFRIATIGGAKTLGLDREIGSIAIGKKADLIAVPLPSKNTGDIYSDLIRETNSCIMSMVNGKIIWKDQRMHE